MDDGKFEVQYGGLRLKVKKQNYATINNNYDILIIPDPKFDLLNEEIWINGIITLLNHDYYYLISDKKIQKLLNAFFKEDNVVSLNIQYTFNNEGYVVITKILI